MADILKKTSMPHGQEIAQLSVAVTAGSTKIVYVYGFKAVGVAALPGGGGTANVAKSYSSVSAVGGGSATWIDWSTGATGTDATERLDGPFTALRLTATTANADFEIVGQMP